MVEKLKTSSWQITGYILVDVPLVFCFSSCFWFAFFWLLMDYSLIPSMLLKHIFFVTIPTSVLYCLCYLGLNWAKNYGENRNREQKD
jgi:hypothetical protein